MAQTFTAAFATYSEARARLASQNYELVDNSPGCLARFTATKFDDDGREYLSYATMGPVSTNYVTVEFVEFEDLTTRA